MTSPIPTEDGSFTLHSHRYGQTYHSSNGALTEARHVFLEASGVSERLRQGLETRVLEIGFGLGLNALLTADLATCCGTALDYHAFEHDLVAADIISGLSYQSLLGKPVLAEALCRFLTVATDETAVRHTTLDTGVQLTLHLQDAATCHIAELCGVGFHAIYLDAFSPDTNAECWSAGFFSALSAVMADNARLSTYSAKGTVRRAMQTAGLTVRKLPGPPGKREMLVARK